MNDDARWMSLALSLGRRGMGRVWPNPAVGCVLVKDGRVVARGWTQDGGRPHAEAEALRSAGAKASGATAYVTLEPCAHIGQTPPCATGLIDAGVARVVIAASDPDPRVSGKGIAMLEAAGIAVTTGVLAKQANRDHAGFLSRITQGRPMVTLKLAMSFDGRIATASGESQWITGPQARRHVHAMRARHDAVLVGAGTARADLPSLTVRDMAVTHQPTRIVVSRNLDLPRTGPLFETAREVPVWLVHGPDAPDAIRQSWADAGARLISADGSARGSLQALGAEGITRVFCEGGAGLAAALLTDDLVDELVVFCAGLAMGADGLAGVGPLHAEARLADIARFTLDRVAQVGADTAQFWHRPRSK